MKKSYEGTELWPFESSTSSTASTPKRTSKDRRFANDQPSTIENAGGGGETDSLSSTQPITYSAFGVTISTFKDPSSSTSPKKKPKQTKQQSSARRRSVGGCHQKHQRLSRDHSPPEDLFEGLGADIVPLLANLKQGANTETSYGSSRLSFLSRDSGSIAKMRGDGTVFHDESMNKSGEFCASLFLPSLSFQSSLPRARHIFGESRGSSDSVMESFVEKLYPNRQSTVAIGTWNLLPILAGSAIFSMPFAVVTGGYFSLIFMVVMSLMSDVTGVLLLDCLYEISPNSGRRKRVRKDLVDIARELWGRAGAFLMHFIVVVYLFLGDVLNMLLLAKSVYSLLHTCTKLSFVALACLFSILAYPTLFIKRLTILAYISLLSIISIMLGVVMLIFIFIKEHNVWAHNYGDIPFLNVEKFPLAVGMIMLTCISHNALPRIEGNLIESSDAPKVIHASYTIATTLNILIGIFGALSFGLKTESLVTLNASRVNEIVKTVIGVSSICYAVLNYPLNMYIVCETIDKITVSTRIKENKKLYYSWIAVTRLILFASTVALALAVPYFGIILGLRGSLIGTCLVFVFPCVFHLKLKWRQLPWHHKLMDIGLLIFGLVLGGISFVVTILTLCTAIQTNTSYQ